MTRLKFLNHSQLMFRNSLHKHGENNYSIHSNMYLESTMCQLQGYLLALPGWLQTRSSVKELVSTMLSSVQSSEVKGLQMGAPGG